MDRPKAIRSLEITTLSALNTPLKPSGISHAELAVIPDAGHFALYWEQKKVIPAVENFLKKPEKKTPFATTETGYHPGETR